MTTPPPGARRRGTCVSWIRALRRPRTRALGKGCARSRDYESNLRAPSERRSLSSTVPTCFRAATTNRITAPSNWCPHVKNRIAPTDFTATHHLRTRPRCKATLALLSHTHSGDSYRHPSFALARTLKIPVRTSPPASSVHASSVMPGCPLLRPRLSQTRCHLRKTWEAEILPPPCNQLCLPSSVRASSRRSCA